MTEILQPQPGAVPYVPPNELSQPFWDGCARGELLYQYFPSSGRAQFSPAPIDRLSLDTQFEWRRSCGRGEIYSWSAVHRPQSPAFTAPYVAAIVTLEEGFNMISNVVGTPIDEVYIGQPVQVEFHVVGELTLPYFAPIAPNRDRTPTL
jgi:uncharacterized OB-fold protein